MRSIYGKSGLMGYVGMVLAFSLLSACDPSDVVRKMGETVRPEELGLKVEWQQAPVLRKGEGEGDFPYGQRVTQEGKVEWNILKLSNVSDRRVDLLWSQGTSTQFRLRVRHLLSSPDMTFQRIKYRVPARITRDYESGWSVTSVKLLRENGRIDSLTSYVPNENEPLPEAIGLAPGEGVQIVASVVPLNSQMILTAGHPGRENDTGFTGRIHYSPIKLPGRLGVDIEFPCRTDVQGLISSVLYVVGSDGVSLRSLALGSALTHRSKAAATFSGPALAELCERGEAAPGPLVKGIPTYFR